MRTIALLLLSLSAACMSFNGQELATREVTTPAAPPVVTLSVGDVRLLWNGQANGPRPVMSPTQVGEHQLRQTLRAWKSRGLVADWGKPGELRAEPRFELAISGTQNEQGSLLAAVLCGATVGLFPSSSTLVYDWRFVLTDRVSGQVHEVPVHRSQTIWMHLAMLPGLPLMGVGAYRGERDQAMYLYSELERAGAWATR